MLNLQRTVTKNPSEGLLIGEPLNDEATPKEFSMVKKKSTLFPGAQARVINELGLGEAKRLASEIKGNEAQLQ